MKKSLIFKSLAAGLVAYGAAGFFAVPYAIKNVVPQKVSEATGGGKFSVRSAAFNPFTFHLKLEGVVFKTPRGGELFAMKQMALNADPLDYLWRGGWVLKYVALSEPEIAVHRGKDGTFNFAFLTEGGSPEKAQSASEPPKLLIKRFVLKDGALDYRDYAEGKAYALGVGPIGFSLDNIDLRDLSTAEGKLRLYASINEGGFIDLKGKLDALSPLKIGGSVAFDSGKLYTPWRYFRDKFPIEVADGSAAFGFDYRFDSSDVNATEISRLRFDVNRLRIIPKGENRNLLTLGSLRLSEGKLLPMRHRFEAGSLALKGLNVSATRGADGKIDWLGYAADIQKAFPADPAKKTAPAAPWDVRIGAVSLEETGLVWNDNAPKQPYTLSLANGRLHTGVLSADPKELLELSLATDAIRMVRRADGAAIAGIGAVAVEGVNIDREGRFAGVEKVSLVSPEISLKRLKDGSIDLMGYVYRGSRPAPASPQQAKDGGGWGYRVGEIALNDARASFLDEVPSRKVAFGIDRLDAALRGFESNPDTPNDFALNARINAQSTVDMRGEIVRSSLRSSGTFDVRHLNLAWFDPYLEPSTYASLRRGDLSINGHYGYTGSAASVKGKLALNDWVLNDTRDDSVLLGWNTIGVTPFAYAYPDNRLKINHLSIDGLYANALIDEKKVLNFSTLSKPQRNGTKNVSRGTSGNPFGLDVVKLIVRNSSATFSDRSLPLPFKTYIHDLEGSVLGISTTKNVTTFVKLRGGVDEYGLAKIDGQLNTKAPKSFTDMRVAFDNLDLPRYTPYSLQFLGYKIDGGKLFLNLGYKIDAGQLKGDNKVVIRQIELGEEKEGGSPWPMRLVVALLEDSDGVIDIDLPVVGDVNKPDFKYGQVVWQVITNLFTKAVTSPFRLLGSLLGIEDDSLSSVDFEGGSAALQPPQREKLDKLITVLQKRPKLTLEIYGGWNDEADGYALRGEKLLAQALKSDKSLKADSPNALPLDVLEEMAEDALERKELKALRGELEKKYPEEAAYVRHYSAALIERLIPLQPLQPSELEALAQRRSEAIRAHLAKTAGMEKRTVLKGNEKAAPGETKEIPVRLNVIVP